MIWWKVKIDSVTLSKLYKFYFFSTRKKLCIFFCFDQSWLIDYFHLFVYRQSECATLKKELQEEHKHAQYLTLESNKSHETAQIAIREVEAVRQELLEERKHVERVKENFIREVTIVESRAIFAEVIFGLLTILQVWSKYLYSLVQMKIFPSLLISVLDFIGQAKLSDLQRKIKLTDHKVKIISELHYVHLPSPYQMVL